MARKIRTLSEALKKNTAPVNEPSLEEMKKAINLKTNNTKSFDFTIGNIDGNASLDSSKTGEWSVVIFDATIEDADEAFIESQPADSFDDAVRIAYSYVGDDDIQPRATKKPVKKIK